MKWHNYVIGEGIELTEEELADPDIMSEYVTQDPITLGLYNAYVAQGHAPVKAIEEVTRGELEDLGWEEEDIEHVIETFLIICQPLTNWNDYGTLRGLLWGRIGRTEIRSVVNNVMV